MLALRIAYNQLHINLAARDRLALKAAVLKIEAA